ncbi:MAG: MarR family transcriptional regulator [Alphaproteobacteria bacterium]|nr:MarR family transcriptional regulator [Marinicaulis sp.]NOX95986.1 MarR family transcriptional regulator [Alphaproteobacteria bacterium]
MTTITENIFGMRIRRVADVIKEQGREAFWRTGINLDAKLTSVVISLYEKDGQTSSELATTGLSRQLIEARLKQLEKDGYVTSRRSVDDARKRAYSLAPDRRAEISRAVETMIDFEKVYEELWREIGVDLGEAVLKLERALHAKPLLSRLCAEFPQYNNLIKVESNEK